MLFEPRLRAGIHDGSISVAYRRWKRPQVRVGGRYRVGSDRIRSMTEFDFIEVDAVDEILARDIDDADAQLAGYPSAAAARSDVGAQDAADVLYRLAFRKIDMPDPRAELASSVALSVGEIIDIDARLDRMDRSAKPGPWTREVLREIAHRPAVRAKDLESCSRWPDLATFKVQVRKLKNLGLTLSLPVGYRLSPRGAEYLARSSR
ncbi:hypothetical protein [Mycobacteroides abscessus]|uniref:hypothetical protein n=1 Tax=Mycobacteroides abscessus TaxID=36809 RepID=UPI0005E24C6E|nr:hypothetical protein [Mycobacteroides abscessus]AMU31790.1 hypothetical protein A3N97_15305 [Mycobacteroides abscessus]AMU76242.1 hypothetical protein A3O06_18045 [Mycobacteroides abscessus]ANO25187.1 hypothetical protein BAB79_18040 [Mycobacteroides abscessus]MDO3028100.1 hypothetical protein [Mycobacteroides abscessus subsp. massiliense]PVA57569.1 hypothetical protein DDJ72_01200 [Mycobacteroides abscessus]